MCTGGPRRSRAWAGGDRDPSRTICRDGRTGKRDRPAGPVDAAEACGVITINPHPIVWTTNMDVLVALASAVVGFALGYLARSLVSRRRRRKARLRR
jgi:hypothetical protein